MATTQTFPVSCIAGDGETYRVFVPAKDEPSALAAAERQGHTLADGSAPPVTIEPRHEYHYGPVALALSALGFFVFPLAIAGIVLGASSKDGERAVAIGAFALVMNFLLLALVLASQS